MGALRKSCVAMYYRLDDRSFTSPENYTEEENSKIIPSEL